MDKDSSTTQVVNLLERQIALDLHFPGANQAAIAKILRKSKSWVNDLLQDCQNRTKLLLTVRTAVPFWSQR
jgi:hypothetical protein